MSRLAGVDGCPGGWLVAEALGAAPPHLRVVTDIAELLADPPAVTAIDMPIGLPDQIGRCGRSPERLVRPLVGARQSSVFSVPSRAAIQAADYRTACTVALATSEPPRKVSIQLWRLVPKIREIDDLLRARPELRSRLFEVHPEVAFWRMNGGYALDLPKKVKGRAYPPGLDLRAALLRAAGVEVPAAPSGAGPDDVLDALAALWVAGRIARGEARSFPDPPERDGFDLPIAMWA